jgi:hypothetical protein
MAHAIGHCRGLYLSIKSHGSEDNLEDTVENNLMDLPTQ